MIFGKVLALMDLAASAPDLSFLTVSSARGFDLVAELRQKGMEEGPDACDGSLEDTPDRPEKSD